ncbi:MAG: hypothetical protein HN654_09600 [Candidatus Marinimicrobia bacterium]|nr:hypothetical protein [Candidatus Neomarinimicrobiota bacterium]MBT4370929.1 hypothetical protein [Candidatus Neomarinimicrobiota bacterium]MBT4663160.1 hypothetical protein [Candidatus Neomarinimicrobiota bacterium]MBT4828060.1 hypothetical protein [Candidatus Neomarinimicrobiota bacterium]MBT5225893.1 hypothetical protein [Candidatus Neomarinimicrobiota bacterium]
MANDMKSGIGFIIPAAGVVGFFTSLLLGEFLVSIIIAVAGIMVWFLYMLVMESNMPQQMGNMILLFGILLSIGIFFGFGITQNMFGGFEFQPEGSIFALVILFFAVLTGLNFRNQASSTVTSAGASGLSDSDRDLVMDAIKQSQEPTEASDEPRVIVVKQEATPEVAVEEKKEEEQNPYAPYNMANNPYFAYPPDYYYDDDEEDEDDEDWDEEDDDE